MVIPSGRKRPKAVLCRAAPGADPIGSGRGEGGYRGGASTMIYGCREYPYAVAFAEALKEDRSFRSWLLSQTKFVSQADDARLIHEEMLARRSKGTKQYWNSHFHTKCDCYGCRGSLESRETDVLAIFEGRVGFRFAIHVEIKRPGDKFKDADQAPAYRVRAQCWRTKPPERVLPHSDAIAMLIFSEAQRSSFASEIAHFDKDLTFETIGSVFPSAVPISN